MLVYMLSSRSYIYIYAIIAYTCNRIASTSRESSLYVLLLRSGGQSSDVASFRLKQTSEFNSQVISSLWPYYLEAYRQAGRRSEAGGEGGAWEVRHRGQPRPEHCVLVSVWWRLVVVAVVGILNQQPKACESDERNVLM